MMNQRLAERAAFLPKLVTTLSEGYGPRQFRADLMAGLTVAIVALPLSRAGARGRQSTPAACLGMTSPVWMPLLSTQIVTP